MCPTTQRKTWKENSFIQLAIVLILIFLCYSISLQRYCTSHHLSAKGTGWTARQGAKLREYVDDTLSRNHPYQITGFAPIAYSRYTACVEYILDQIANFRARPPAIRKAAITRFGRCGIFWEGLA